MLFVELACFAHTDNLRLSKSRKSDDESFRLHSLELLEIGVAYPLEPQLYVGVGSLALGIHC